MLPLLTAAQCGAPIEVIDTLLRAFPAAAWTPCPAGWLPLHWAAMMHASANVVAALLAAFPAAASATNMYGTLPVHCATLNDEGGAASIDVVAQLLVAHPEGALVRCPIDFLFILGGGTQRLPDLSQYEPRAIHAAVRAVLAEAAKRRRILAVASWRAWRA